MATTNGQPPVRLGVLDSDTGFLQVLANRLDAAGWQHRVLASPVPIDALVSMRFNVLVIDLAVLGPAGWSYLEKVCERLPALGVIVCTGRSSVSQRVRGLRLGADDWITKPCHPEELIARAEAVARRRRRAEAARVRGGPRARGRARDPGRPVPGLRGRLQRRPDAARVRAHPAAGGRRPGRCSRARRSTSGCGATRWSTATARSTSSCASCARSSRRRRRGWRYIHTHFGIGYRFAAEPLEAPEVEPAVAVVAEPVEPVVAPDPVSAPV